MAKLYFKYGAMGSSKTAQALITKFNYEERNMTVWLIKPAADTRDGENIIRSRIGLTAEAEVISPNESIKEAFDKHGRDDVIIVDEANFFTPEQIDEPARHSGRRKHTRALLWTEDRLPDAHLPRKQKTARACGLHNGDKNDMLLRL